MTRSTRRRSGLLPALALLLAVALTGCGSDDGGDDLSAAGTAAADGDADSGDGAGDGGSSGDGASDDGGSGGDRSEVDPEQAELDFYECMREHGVDLPDPDPGQPGMQLRLPQGDPNAQAAAEECRALLPNGGEPPQLDASQLESLRAFTGCMRDNGIDMADPGADGTLSVPQGVNPESAEFQTAMSTCQPLLEGAPIRMRAGGGPQ
ncbi:hypothetical protein [Jiangella mangrovi]|uniref:DUF732 domain-containing protein n=1 Tax=Jiangella mangrovi TaxID=1524084 RepID=A0A7W9LIY1_9ACTN|nr:hypothetical protein [Jiangella mangrovi]MBB5785429.1 hypothetical protein [Jiangella mangrovi]